MLDRMLARVETVVVTHPGAVLGLAVALCVVAVWLGTGLELRTSRNELVPEGDVNQARWDALRADFADPDPLIVAIERVEPALPAAELESLADRLAEALEARPEFDSVFYRVDMDWLSRQALHLAPPAPLLAAVAALDATLAAPDGSIELSSFAALNERLAARIEGALATGSALPSADAGTEAARLHDYLDAQRDFLADPEGWVQSLGDTPLSLVRAADRGSVSPSGHLATTDGDVVFLLAHLAGEATAGLPRQRAAVAAARDAAADLLGGRTDVRTGLTGGPAMEVDEMTAIRSDGRRTSLIAIGAVFLLSLLAFHDRFHALLGLLTLVAGVLWSIGAVQLELGYLNMITTGLVPILVGMGIDYAVHPISQYEIERRRHARHEAVLATFRKTGRPVLVSALTTSAAFFCFLFMSFRGFSELGLVTGIGVLLCLLAAVVVLPALLIRFGRGHREDRAAVVDNLWDEGAAAMLCGRPRVTVAAALLLTLAAVAAGWQVRLNTSLLDLLPLSSESLGYLQLMNDRSALRNDFNLVVASDLEELRAMRERAEAQPTVERFESVLTFLPAEPDASREAVAAAAALLDRVAVVDRAASRAELVASLRRLEAALAEAADNAFVTGLGELAGELERARATAEELMSASPEGSADAARQHAEQALRERTREFLGPLREAAQAAPPTIEALPSTLRDRFLTGDGDLVGYLYPNGSMYDAGFLPDFVDASREVSATTIGFPVLFEDHSRLITEGFGTALAVGAALVVFLLLLDLRHLGHTLLALVPVVTGAVWLLGLMVALGLDFNFANLVAVPIVLGVGIDAGVHIVHRYRREGDAGMVTALAHTGRAILVASLTTMAGFGSLALASHRGMASLGVLLFLGVGSCLLAALVLLPNLILALGMARR